MGESKDAIGELESTNTWMKQSSCMGSEVDHQILYPTKEDIFLIHSDIIQEDDEASEGVLNGGNVEFALDFIEHGHFGQVPETLHEKAVELLRLLSANHAFADGNKRTALNATWTFYALNGYYFDYGEDIKAILKMFAVMERMVDKEEAIDYFEDITLVGDHPDVPSEVVQMMHLSKWDENVRERFGEISVPEEGDEGDWSDEDLDKAIEELSELLAERNQLVESFIEFREEYEEHLTADFVNYIDEVVEEWQDVTKFLTDLAKSDLEQRDIEEIAKDHNITSEE